MNTRVTSLKCTKIFGIFPCGSLINLRKEEQLKILKFLLGIERTIGKCKCMLGDFKSSTSEDQERYMKMAMKLDSSDPEILERNKNRANVTDTNRFYLKRSNTSLSAFCILQKLWDAIESKTKLFGRSRYRLWIYHIFQTINEKWFL